jgi:hypothetical protein
MTSEVFGNENFEYDDVDQALAGIQRLVEQAKATGDGIERLVGIVVNAETGEDE